MNNRPPFKIGDLVRLKLFGHEIVITSITPDDGDRWVIEGEEVHSQSRMTTLHSNLTFISTEQIQLLGTWE